MFKKIVGYALVALMIFSTMPTSSEATSIRPMHIPIKTNGIVIQTDASPIMVNNRVLVPFRAISQSMGANVHWDEQQKQVIVQKDGKTISIRLQSQVAFINEQTVTLDVPPIVYKGRVFVPIRFISESLGGKVEWTGREVNISFSALVPLSDGAFVNGAPLTTPLMTNGQYRYVSIKSLVTALDANVEWSEDHESLTIHTTRGRIVLYENSKEAEVDGQPVTLQLEPIRLGDEWYISLSAITMLFGGQFTINSAKEIHISIPRTTFRSTVLPKQSYSIARPNLVKEINVVDKRRLLVSDNPEMLAISTIPNKSGTLSADYVQSVETEVDHRVFGWHINLFDEKVNVAIVIENLSSTTELEVINRKGTYRISPNSWGHYDVGLPIAETMLRNALTVSSPVVIRPQSQRILHMFDVPTQQLIGFLYDFTVAKRSGEELSYRIRTVVTSGLLSPITVDPTPVPLDSYATHARGVWEGATIETTLPTYTVGSEPISYNISNGKTDHYMSVQRALSPTNMTIHNPGHYGAVYRVHIPVTRSANSTQMIRLRFSGRGGAYCGAMRINGSTYVIPPLEPVTQSAYIDYYMWGQQDVITLEFMHAGGSALPLGIEISSIQ